MNCEQVEELLSAYLDNMLAPEERRAVAVHLQTCRSCNETLADYRHNDALLARLPQVHPDASLRERIFSSPEFLELSGTAQESDSPAEWTVPKLPARSPRRDTPGRPHLVAIPGGRSTGPGPTLKIETPKLPQRRGRGLRVMLLAIAALLVVAIGIGALAGFTGLLHSSPTANNGGITPPAAGPQGQGPLSAGSNSIRYVFLRGGALWSELSDGSATQPDRLTPATVTVSDQWAVSPPLPPHKAGDMLAYIDLQKAYIHIIRSDGLEDTLVNQPLLKAGVLPDTGTWANILNSLAWSPDGNQLAFLADPNNTGQTHLYLYSKITGKVTQVPITAQGSVSHPVWSPDGARLAFEVSKQGITSILDYNTQNHGALTVASGIGSGTTAGESVLTLDWSPDVDLPAITWSVGNVGHVRSVWVHHVFINSNEAAQEILNGDYAQAIYSRNGHGGAGSWLVITSIAGRAGDIWYIDITSGAIFTQLTRGQQVNFAEWSPDGTSIGYLDTLSEGVGTFHIVNVDTAVDTSVASGVTYNPAPAWSLVSPQVAFSTGTSIGIASTQAAASPHYLTLKGAASALAWSVASPDQLVAGMNDGQQGIFLVDTQHDHAVQADKLGTGGPILWTMIP
ncbi:MAG TPA: zf-HC2 domain-containing protein [Ktedonobacteraceae bacterium]|nr:zf-HC2 domain-containing protein [Ktedonobacteraceae bacterium]